MHSDPTKMFFNPHQGDTKAHFCDGCAQGAQEFAIRAIAAAHMEAEKDKPMLEGIRMAYEVATKQVQDLARDVEVIEADGTIPNPLDIARMVSILYACAVDLIGKTPMAKKHPAAQALMLQTMFRMESLHALMHTDGVVGNPDVVGHYMGAWSTPIEFDAVMDIITGLDAKMPDPNADIEATKEPKVTVERISDKAGAIIIEGDATEEAVAAALVKQLGALGITLTNEEAIKLVRDAERDGGGFLVKKDPKAE